jgi:hypothetical protein
VKNAGNFIFFPMMMQSLVRTQRRLFLYNSSSSFTQRLQFFQSAAGFCNQSEIENQAPPPRPEQDYDVVIVGGGMVGAAVGCGLGMYEFFSEQPLAD